MQLQKNKNTKDISGGDTQNIPHHRGSLSTGAEIVKAPHIQLNGFTKKPTMKKQDSLLSLMSPTSNYDESPQSEQIQFQQIAQKKAENKDKMIEDFKHYIMKQQKSFDYSGIGYSKDLSNHNNNNHNSNSINYFGSIKNHNIQQLSQIPENSSFASIKDDMLTQQAGQSQTVALQQQLQQKPKLSRQASIAQAIQKKLKIVHKSKEQLFNEKLQLFKGVSTYIETKSYLQNLNLLNKKNLVQTMKKNYEWNKEFDEFKERQDFLEKTKLTEEIEESDDFNDFQDKEYYSNQEIILNQTKRKYDISNPQYDKNVKSLLNKAQDHLQLMKDQKDNNENNIIEQGDLESDIANQFLLFLSNKVYTNNINQELTDENQFYDDLKTILVENKKKQEEKKEEKKVQEVFKDQQQKQYELEIINQIYSNPKLTEKLSPEQMQEFVNQQVKLKFNPDSEISSFTTPLKDKILKGLDIDLNTNLDAKHQYQEYVEKATSIRKTLKRLNENLFKHKWANAQMKRKKEQEQMKNQIIRKIQNHEIEYNRIDALFPSKKKMLHVKSKVNSNIEYNSKGIAIRSDSIESNSPKVNDKKFFTTQVEVFQANQTNQNQPSLNQTNDDFTKMAQSARIDSSVPNSLKHIEMKDSSRYINPQSYLYQTPSGYVRQVTKVNLTEDERKQKQEQFEKQEQKKQQKQLKQEILKNINYFQAKKSSAPNLSASTTNLPSIKQTSLLNSPQSSSIIHHSVYSSPFIRVNNSKLKSQNSQYYMSNTSKASTVVGSSTIKEINQSQHSPIKVKKNTLNKFFSMNMPSSAKQLNYQSSYFSPSKQLSKEKQQQFHTTNPAFDVSAQKGQMISLITNLESEKQIRRKDRKEMEKSITQIQTNCTQDLSKLKGQQIGSMKDLLDIDFLKFSMKKHMHIRDSNIKNFLYQSN